MMTYLAIVISFTAGFLLSAVLSSNKLRESRAIVPVTPEELIKLR